MRCPTPNSNQIQWFEEKSVRHNREEKKERKKEGKEETKKQRKKERKEKGENEGIWPTFQEVGSFPTWNILV